MPYGADELVLQVTAVGSADVDVDVQGIIDKENSDFVTVSIVNHTGLKIEDSIAAEGIYSVPVNGVRQIQLVNNGSTGDVIVYGVAMGIG